VKGGETLGSEDNGGLGNSILKGREKEVEPWTIMEGLQCSGGWHTDSGVKKSYGGVGCIRLTTSPPSVSRMCRQCAILKI
jgi:hypothetical protein